MLDARAIITPGIQINYFDMPEIGDEIEPHAHAYGHASAVLRGAVLILSQGERVLRAGDDPVFFQPCELHGFRSMEVGTEMISIIDTTQLTFDE